jgi:beta-glucosidase
MWLGLVIGAGVGVALAQDRGATPHGPAVYKDATLPVERRVPDLLSRMTLEEKVAMLSGSGWMESAPNERLGIPAIKMADGPMSVRSWAGSSAVTHAQGQTQQVLSTVRLKGTVDLSQ